ncbi:MAG: hypothetical protein LBD20_02835, partial [Spirochaetaceae bacterium]|jgi:hypothetical protein|nr:hypothetical protein [Spirochaetaceae bacterium]
VFFVSCAGGNGGESGDREAGPLYQFSLSESAYTFDTVEEGYAAADKSITITNTGTLDTGVLSIAITGANADVFTRSPATAGSIAPGQTGTFSISTTAGQSSGTYTAAVTVTGAEEFHQDFDITLSVEPRTYDEFGGKSADRTFTILSQEDWTAALASISAGTGDDEVNYWIDIAGNVSAAGSTNATFGSRNDITVIIRGEDTKLSLASTGNLIKTAEGQTVSIRDNLTLEGYSNNNISVVHVPDGDFMMSGSTKITGNSVGSAFGGGVRVTGGTFTMTGSSSVTGNATTGNSNGDGGGVSITAGFFYMSENATVSGNTAVDDGGGVYMTGGFFMMSGSAKITGNITHIDTSKNANGGGMLHNGGTFVMKDSAEISGNTAWGSNGSSGAGIEMLGGVFRFGGGTITGCDGTHDLLAHDPSNPAARDSCNVNWTGTAERTGAGAALRKGEGGTAQIGPVDDSGEFTGGTAALATSETTIYVISGELQ